MKRMISMLMVLMLVVSAVSMCYAATPRFVSLTSYSTNFSIDGTGQATYAVSADPKDDSVLDKVTATIKITNASGSCVYNQTKTLTYSVVTGCFTGGGIYKLSSRGQYRMQVTFKCYDGTTLLESVSADARFATW